MKRVEKIAFGIAGLVFTGGTALAVIPANAAVPTPNPAQTVTWHQITTPRGFPALEYTCKGTEGIYLTSAGDTTVIPNDPSCITTPIVQ